MSGHVVMAAAVLFLSFFKSHPYTFQFFLLKHNEYNGYLIHPTVQAGHHDLAVQYPVLRSLSTRYIVIASYNMNMMISIILF